MKNQTRKKCIQLLQQAQNNGDLRRATYYAVTISSLMKLMRMAGFVDVRRLDDRFFQPMIIGTKKAQQIS